MADWRAYLNEAQKFWDVAEAFSRPDYANQAVSNAVHAVIAASDAICLYLANERARGESHAEASRALQKACRGTTWEAAARQKADQPAQVLEAKAASQYRGTRLAPETVERVLKQARRLIGWAQGVLPPEH